MHLGVIGLMTHHHRNISTQVTINNIKAQKALWMLIFDLTIM